MTDPTFTDWFKRHAAGTVDVELQTAISDVTEAVLAQDKKGTVTLTINFERLGTNALTVTASVKAKAPEAPEVSIFYRDLDGSLGRNDPFAFIHNEDGPEVVSESVTPLADGLGVVDNETGEIRRVIK